MSLSNATGDGGNAVGDGVNGVGGHVMLPVINTVFKKVFLPLGMDWHPFQIGWYNDLVGPRFALGYPPNTVAFVVISGPEVFEKCVLPYLKKELAANPQLQEINDPLDDAIVNSFKIAQLDLTKLELETEALFDFQLHPSRKPKVLVQTAAHVAGAAQYFHQNKLPGKIQQEFFSQESKLSGVAVHPVYGGWFAIRGVIIFTNLELNEDDKGLIRPESLNLISEEERIVTLLKEFAYNWEEDKWRTVFKGSGPEYSQDFKDFLSTVPGERWEFFEGSWISTDFSVFLTVTLPKFKMEYKFRFGFYFKCLKQD